MNFVCVDGGGTKLNAIWFDENMRELGTARAKGINSTISPKAECQKQMRCKRIHTAADTTNQRLFFHADKNTPFGISVPR